MTSTHIRSTGSMPAIEGQSSISTCDRGTESLSFNPKNPQEASRNLMMNAIRGGLIFASVLVLHWLTAPAISQEYNLSQGNNLSSPDRFPPAGNPPQLDNSQPSPPSPQLEPELDAQGLPSNTLTVPSCPPGQFASAFSDVPPEDWAYEAVNRLAIGPIRCFPR
ncbi:hypothetical protein [Egbenema bharatensis]|uniref:hypothetical protein n=1 Tax=Egbenema bharatensis TaxID=3463334 RepID=UPI003A8C7F1C